MSDSKLVPRTFGVLVAFGTVNMMAASCMTFLAPQLGRHYAVMVLAVMGGIVGLGSLCARLIMVGLTVPKRKETTNKLP